MSVAAILLAAGRAQRFGQDKLQLSLGGKPVWRWGLDTFREHPRINHVVMVAREDQVASFADSGADAVVPGGQTRTESVRHGLKALPASIDFALIHDAARPFVSAGLIDEVIQAVETASGAVCPILPVTDTIRRIVGSSNHIVDRTTLFAAQTPQAARAQLLQDAYAAFSGEATDDVAVVEAYGMPTTFVSGSVENFKITMEADYQRACRALAPIEVRTGFGYDVHRFSTDPNRPLMLGGVRHEGPGLEGHSDADALLHAIVDALLGAVGAGDIGILYPNTDPAWKGAPSLHFLKETAERLRAEGWTIVNIDATVLAERPKLGPRYAEMRRAVAEGAGVDVGRVSIKATTNEGLGSIGRAEGIAAHAVATISR